MERVETKEGIKRVARGYGNVPNHRYGRTSACEEENGTRLEIKDFMLMDRLQSRHRSKIDGVFQDKSTAR